MALVSEILAGNARLDQAAAGGPSVKKGPPHDDPDAVKRIQRALVKLGFPMPLSFPMGASEPDGVFGNETYKTAIAYQKREWPKDLMQWDGRVGKNTLGRMDSQLGPAPPPVEDEMSIRQPLVCSTRSRCLASGDPPVFKLPGFRRV